MNAAKHAIESGSSQAEQLRRLLASASGQCAPHILDQGNLTEVITLIERSHILERGRPVWQLFLEATLDLAFFNDVEMVTLVILVEDILTRPHVHHFEAVDQSQLIECL